MIPKSNCLPFHFLPTPFCHDQKQEKYSKVNISGMPLNIHLSTEYIEFHCNTSKHINATREENSKRSLKVTTSKDSQSDSRHRVEQKFEWFIMKNAHSRVHGLYYFFFNLTYFFLLSFFLAHVFYSFAHTLQSFFFEKETLFFSYHSALFGECLKINNPR